MEWNLVPHIKDHYSDNRRPETRGSIPDMGQYWGRLYGPTILLSNQYRGIFPRG
jgi:hypothetical protein